MTSFTSREVFLAAVLRWIIPLVLALSTARTTFLRDSLALFRFRLATSVSTFLVRVFRELLTMRFLMVSFLVCLTLFRTDLLFLGVAFAGKEITPLNLEFTL